MQCIALITIHSLMSNVCRMQWVLLVVIGLCLVYIMDYAPVNANAGHLIREGLSGCKVVRLLKSSEDRGLSEGLPWAH